MRRSAEQALHVGVLQNYVEHLFPNGTDSIPQNQDINKNGTTVYIPSFRNVEVVQMSDMRLK